MRFFFFRLLHQSVWVHFSIRAYAMGKGLLRVLLLVVLLANVVWNAITTKGRHFSVNEGESVELPCNVKDLSELHVLHFLMVHLISSTDVATVMRLISSNNFLWIAAKLHFG